MVAERMDLRAQKGIPPCRGVHGPDDIRDWVMAKDGVGHATRPRQPRTVKEGSDSDVLSFMGYRVTPRRGRL